MEGNIFNKILAVGIIFLFIGIGIQPAFANEPIIMLNIKKEENTNPKEYLFQTIINIANNPDVKDLFNQDENKAGFISLDYNFRNVNLKLLIRNPRLLFSMLFTKPSITPGYIECMYNKGCKIVNIIAEDEAKKVTESVTVNNPKFFDELNNIITNDEEIFERIATLKEMNKELKPNSPVSDYDLICNILLNTLWALQVFQEFLEIFMQKSVIMCLLLYPLFLTVGILGVSVLHLIIFVFYCL